MDNRSFWCIVLVLFIEVTITFAQSACNQTHFGNDCAIPCTCILNNTENCNDTTGECACLSGWKGLNCETDINECDNETICSDINSICINLNGSAECRCDIGFETVSANRSCQACNATHYGLNCANTCSCNLNNTVDCNDTTGECLCAAGWNGTTCDEDVDECLNANFCPGYMEVCFNMNGSVECRCEIGSQRSEVDQNCQACNSTYYGYECSNSCTCIMANTEYCNDTTGSCTCYSGWKGINCETDIDECENDTFCLDTNSSCVNLNGSAECRCNLGFENSSTNESCLACNETHYGYECAVPCSCVFNNTVDCNDTTGECLCAAGWNGTTCDEDVNECLNASYCPDYMEVCFNMNGSAECRCEIGFQRSELDQKCQGT
ncbi:protein draper-like [Physella acuta]|uniref:protein draper-like n=1 Tax=Physella acuta TaxID=109671 RepID=UPI0027DCE06E|nr:protein draper-like [Physella acuta]